MRPWTRWRAPSRAPRASPRMAELPPPMKWWGWGDPARPAALPPHALDFLRAELGISGERFDPVALEDVRLAADAALPEKPRARISEAVGTQWVRDERATRVTHAAGKGY